MAGERYYWSVGRLASNEWPSEVAVGCPPGAETPGETDRH